MALTFLSLGVTATAAEWQWSVPVGNGRAFLWIPPDCERVRAVVVGQHNMLEESVLEHATMRRELAALGIAEVWVAPPFDPVFRFDQDAGERFEAFMRALADVSGYDELASAPAVPIGHSACASFVWNFAAWAPERTLAVISLKGDAPLTTMTGSGRPNPEWGERAIDGVPGLMVMGEYEWLEGRLTPALAFRMAHPRAPIALLAEPGRGHFDAADELVAFLVMFIRKAAAARLPDDESNELKPVDPDTGWLVERWRLNEPRRFVPALAAHYAGDPAEAFWCFDEEMARATQTHFADAIGRKPQLLAFVQDGAPLPQSATHNQVTLRFEPLEDGISFRLGTAFLDSVEAGSPNLARWTALPAGTPLGHATGGGAITLSRITGPIVQTSADTFAVALNRTWLTTDRRNRDVWLLATHPGDATYKSAVQQALLRLPLNSEGAAQTVTFPAIGDQPVGTEFVHLRATSDAGLPVRYFVRDGPAEIDGGVLRITAIPPRAKFPVAITVVAWQWGRGGVEPIRMAEPVEASFAVTR